MQVTLTHTCRLHLPTHAGSVRFSSPHPLTQISLSVQFLSPQSVLCNQNILGYLITIATS